MNFQASSSEPGSSDTVEEIKIDDLVVISPQFTKIAEPQPASDYDTEIGLPTASFVRQIFGKFALIGYSLGFVNTMVLPNLFITQGRAAYFFPLIVCYMLVGVPIMMIETVVGQYSGLHPNVVFSRISPILNSVGGMFSMAAFYRATFFMPFTAWILFALSSFFLFSPLPRDTCYSSSCIHFADIDRCSPYWIDEDIVSVWNIPKECRNLTLNLFNSTNLIRIGVFTNFIDHYVFNPDTAQTSGLVIGIHFGLWVLLAFIVVMVPKKIRQISSVVGVIALSITIIIFLYTLSKGIVHPKLFNPDWSFLKKPAVWVLAALTTLFSLSLCDGGVIRLTSYNSFNNNIMLDALLTCGTDFVISGMHIYIVNAAMSLVISEFYPGVKDVSKIQQSLMWSKDAYFLCSFGEFALRVSRPWVGVTVILLYYLSLATLMFQSVLVSYESLLTALLIRWKLKNRISCAVFTIGICCCSAFFCTFLVVPFGSSLIHFMLNNVVLFLSFVAFVEVFALSYLYGYENFCRDIETMIGWRPTFIHYIEISTYKFIAPLILASSVVFATYSVLGNLFIGTYQNRIDAASKLTILMSFLILIPIFVCIQLYKLRKENRKFRILITPTSNWGQYQPVIQEEAVVNSKSEMK